MSQQNLTWNHRGKRLQGFFKITILKQLSKFTWKHLEWTHSFRKVAGLEHLHYYKSCSIVLFYCKLAKFFRAPFSMSTSVQLPLNRLVHLTKSCLKSIAEAITSSDVNFTKKQVKWNLMSWDFRKNETPSLMFYVEFWKKKSIAFL